jgi:hypothetical protein
MLDKYWEKHGSVSDFAKSLETEIWEFRKAYKKHMFPTEKIEVLDGVSDSEFYNKYCEMFKDTAPQELAELAEKVWDAMYSMGYDPMKYIDAHKKYKKIKEGESTNGSSQKVIVIR